MVYDPANQTLLADKGRIEFGERHQAIIPELIQQNEEEEKETEEEKDKEEEMETDEKKEEEKEEEKGAEESEKHEHGIRVTDRESVVYHMHHNLTDRDIDQFLIIARWVLGFFSS